MNNRPDNTLAYFDQTFFLSLRALGQGPIGQYVWVYDHGVDVEALRRFHANLGRGLLGRRVERSSLPFGRHSWISWPGPFDVEISARAVPRSEIRNWVDEQAQVWVDPEHGPSWRLAFQPLIEGGAVVTLVISHTVADGGLGVMAIADAVKGVTRDLGYPQPRSRSKFRALLHDLRVTARSTKDVARALAAIPSAAKDIPRWKQAARKAPAPGLADATAGRGSDRKGSDKTVMLLSALARIEIERWDERAASLSGTSNSLFLAVAAKLGEALGMVNAEGLVNFAIPVSERAEGDHVGNALSGVTLSVDPAAVSTDLTSVRAGLKAALSGLVDDPNALGGPLAITPFVPKVLARQAERVGVKNMAINCSNLGNIDPAVNRPDGTDAESFSVRGIWARVNCRTSPLALPGGFLFPVVSGRLNGTVFVNVNYATPDKSFTRERLIGMLERVLADFGIEANVS